MLIDTFAATTDQGFLFKPLEALLDLTTQGETVGIDLVQTERDQVIDVALHFVHVPNQEQHLQDVDVEGLHAGVGRSGGLAKRRPDRRYLIQIDRRARRLHKTLDPPSATGVNDFLSDIR